MNSQNLLRIRAQLKANLFNTEKQSPTKSLSKRNSLSSQLTSLSFSHSQTEQVKSETGSAQSAHQQQEQQFDSKYTVLEELGSGAHAVVYKCSLKENPNNDPEIIQTIKQTFTCNQRLKHQNICQAYELFVDEQKGQSYLVMEYCPFQSLQYYIGRKKKFTTELIRDIFIQLIKTVEYMHLKGICHRDLKPDNIMVDLGKKYIKLKKKKKIQSSSLQVKVVDLGVSKRFRIQKNLIVRDMWTRTGTLFYQSPEIFDGVGYNEKVDIWSCGVILYQLLSGMLPFQDESIMDTIELIQRCIIPYQDFPFLIQDLVKRMLKKKPNKRLSASECLLHPWLQQQKQMQPSTLDDIDMKNIENNKIDVSQSTTNMDWSCVCSNSQQQISKMDLQFKSPIHHIQKPQQSIFGLRYRSSTAGKLLLEETNSINSPLQSDEMSPLLEQN